LPAGPKGELRKHRTGDGRQRPQFYGLLFGAGIVGIMITNLLNSGLVRRLGSDRLMRIGTVSAALAGMLLAVDARTDWGGLMGLVIPLFLFISAVSVYLCDRFHRGQLDCRCVRHFSGARGRGVGADRGSFAPSKSASAIERDCLPSGSVKPLGSARSRQSAPAFEYVSHGCGLAVRL
jgi:hypothetical protein